MAQILTPTAMVADGAGLDITALLATPTSTTLLFSNSGREILAVCSATTSQTVTVDFGTLVLGEQNQGLPLDKATVSLSRRPPLGFEYGAGAVYEGINNELDQPQFVTLNASIGYRTRDWEVSLNGTNLTDVYDQRFTITNGGVPYGAVGPPITTDAYALQGTALTATITRRI